MKTLETHRLRLRAFKASDLDQYSEYLSNPAVVRYLGRGQPKSREETWREMAMFLGHWHLKGYGMWALETRENSRFLGRVGFHNPEGWPGFEIGWVLGQEHWGNGYATEAARAALEYAFSNLDRDSVINLIHPEKSASIAVARRLGQSFHSEIEVEGIGAVLYCGTEAVLYCGTEADFRAIKSI